MDFFLFFYKYPKKYRNRRVSVFGIGTNTEIPKHFRYRYIPVPKTEYRKNTDGILSTGIVSTGILSTSIVSISHVSPTQ